MLHGILMAILAAALYAINAPFSKILLRDIPPTLMAGLLYLGAGLGMGLISFLRKAAHRTETEARLTKAELLMVAGVWLSSVDQLPKRFRSKRRKRAEANKEREVLPGKLFKQNNESVRY